MATYDDPRILRAIAHPARGRILSELSASGSLRAADVARVLDIPANQASFHLRQLAKYGLVEEAPEEARDRRDRVWRMTADDISIRTQDMFDQPGGEAALAVYRQSARAWGHLLVDRAQADRKDPDREVYVVDAALRLTQDELGEYAADLDALQQRWRERTHGRDDGRTTYSTYHLIQPYPDLPGDEAPDPVRGEVRVVGFGPRAAAEDGDD